MTFHVRLFLLFVFIFLLILVFLKRIFIHFFCEFSFLPEHEQFFADVPIPTSHRQSDQRNEVLVEMVLEFGAAAFAGDSDEDDDFAAESNDGVVILVAAGRWPRKQQRLAVR